jgi:hypothetical protein
MGGFKDISGRFSGDVWKGFMISMRGFQDITGRVDDISRRVS